MIFFIFVAILAIEFTNYFTTGQFRTVGACFKSFFSEATYLNLALCFTQISFSFLISQFATTAIAITKFTAGSTISTATANIFFPFQRFAFWFFDF